MRATEEQVAKTRRLDYNDAATFIYCFVTVEFYRKDLSLIVVSKVISYGDIRPFQANCFRRYGTRPSGCYQFKAVDRSIRNN